MCRKTCLSLEAAKLCQTIRDRPSDDSVIIVGIFIRADMCIRVHLLFSFRLHYCIQFVFICWLFQRLSIVANSLEKNHRDLWRMQMRFP